MTDASDTDGVHAEAAPGGMVKHHVEHQGVRSHALLPGKFYDLNAEHAKLLKFIHENPMQPARILGACVEYLKHGTPEMIRLADAVDFAITREVALMKEQIAKGLKI